jgi:hypothetical protein
MCTFRTHGHREHLLEGCGAQQGVCRKTPDIKQLSVPSGELHSSLPTPLWSTSVQAMLSEVLRAGREPTAGLSHLSTPDSILMSYQNLRHGASSRGRDIRLRADIVVGSMFF